MNQDIAFISAGGTGGHINSAIALGEKLNKDGVKVYYITGSRPLDLKLFKEHSAIFLEVYGLRGKSFLAVLKGIYFNFISIFKIFNLYLKFKPKFAIGCGGYVCGPVLLVGYILRKPIFIIEQNSIMGLTNKLLSLISNLIFTHFRETKGIAKFAMSKVRVSGNPTRSSLIKISRQKINKKKLKILVFGGSLGAKEINQLIIEFIKQYKGDQRFEIKHQVGFANGATLMSSDKNNITYSQYEYFDNIQNEYSWCDMIISRAGASTISEIRYVQKPIMFIPFPHAVDNHQFYNAQMLQKECLFPIFIEQAISLKENNFKRLMDFILVASMYDNTLENNLSIESPTDFIIKAITKYVQ